MGEKELESVMLKFIRDEADVLMATTIVENGLDIPRANTILINRADRLGLAAVYQLRGGGGRWGRGGDGWGVRASGRTRICWCRRKKFCRTSRASGWRR